MRQNSRRAQSNEEWHVYHSEKRDETALRANLEIIHTNPKISKWMEDFRDLSVYVCMYFMSSNSAFKSVLDPILLRSQNVLYKM